MAQRAVLSSATIRGVQVFLGAVPSVSKQDLLRIGGNPWACAVGARDHVAHSLAVDAVVADKAGDFQREMFSRDWGINNREELLAQLNSLGEAGHRHRNGMMLRHEAMLWRPRIS